MHALPVPDGSEKPPAAGGSGGLGAIPQGALWGVGGASSFLPSGEAAGPLPAPGAPEAAKAKGGERSARGTTPGRGGGSERPRCLRGVALRRHRARRVPGRGRERDAGQVSEEGVRGAPSAGTRGSWLSRHVLCNDIRLRYGEPSVKTPLGSHRVRRGWSCRQRHDEEKVLFVQRLLWRKTLLPP